MWYRRVIGADRTPVVDTWWQTETGAIMISPLPGVSATKPGAAIRPLPGINADVVDDQGQPVPNGGGGFLVLTEPWPAMLRGIWGDDARYRDTYWSRFAEQGYYFAGDGAKKDTHGDLWLLGRVDDVMLISGHNISTTEVESALASHPAVAEAAVVGATTTPPARPSSPSSSCGRGRRPGRRRADQNTARPRHRRDRRHRQTPPDPRRHHTGRLHRDEPDPGQAPRQQRGLNQPIRFRPAAGTRKFLTPCPCRYQNETVLGGT
jgi:acyl-CoA synthetase (AMP-forming)/AMP-acid ligase II